MMMRRAAKIILIITLLAGIGMLYGCGSSDLLDENEQRYQVSMALNDHDETTLDIDTDFITDCDGDLTTTDPEPYTNVFAEVTLSVSNDSTGGITLESYRIEYIPLETPDGLGGTVLPPDLAEPEDGHFSIPILPGGSSTFTITWLNFNTKAEYNAWHLATGVYGRYNMRLTLYFKDEFGEDREITVEETVFMGAYYLC